jgi:hypothetical protein
MKYRDAVEDTRSFQKVLRGIAAQLAANEHNAVYEAGLIYVCMRNIAMAASSVLCEHPDFTRYSPFNLPSMRPCPISRAEFNLTMDCRMASQRGVMPPSSARAAVVTDLYRRLEPWIEELCVTVEARS